MSSKTKSKKKISSKKTQKKVRKPTSEKIKKKIEKHISPKKVNKHKEEIPIEQDVNTDSSIKIADNHANHLKKHIWQWLDHDDKIKRLNEKIKKYKEIKKERESTIMEMIEKLGIGDDKMNIHDDNKNLRSRVYRHKSVTKGAIKEDIIKNALMEIVQNEKQVDQMVKKIESKRQINERYYLKRTKGNADQ